MVDDLTSVRVDVGVLKTQMTTITALCEKMDRVIEKIVDQQERYINQIYDDMEKRRVEKNNELKEVNNRIDTVIDKVQLTEHRIMEEIKQLRKEMSEKFEQEQKSVDKLQDWKWMVAGGIVVISWLISNVDYDTIVKLLK